MLLKGFTRIVVIVCPILLLLFLFIASAFRDLIEVPSSRGLWRWSDTKSAIEGYSRTRHQGSLSLATVFNEKLAETHVQVFSSSTKDGKYFGIDLGSRKANNPNIIPHPSLEDTWIVVAVQSPSEIKNSMWFAELVCNAVFQQDTLVCIDPPLLLPIAATPAEKCPGELDFFKFAIGPHDARVFFGPNSPYAVWGSNSRFTCFGQYMQDFRMLTDWGFEPFIEGKFREPTELQRPEPWSPVEKNWFVFWDNEGQMYAHYDISPKRVFAELHLDGSVGPDLASNAADVDEQCMGMFMPAIGPSLESLHQSTNSLSLTMCRRADPACRANEDNTFIFTIIQHKTYYSFHSVYEPYVMLFKQNAPFHLHAIGRKPIWIHGRGLPGESLPRPLPDEVAKAWNQTEMFYVTSMSWKTHGMKYHGYLDDPLFLAFGIEDKVAGGIDIEAGDLMVDLGFCSP
jgi:hypothetical protein